jgi:hypothetical protein
MFGGTILGKGVALRHFVLYIFHITFPEDSLHITEEINN